MIPSTVQHSSSAAWGENVHEFHHKRFVKSPDTKKPNPVAFRAFGGGATLCPGRHFASTEILAFASVILLRFDIKPLGGGGWDTAAYKQTNAAFRLPNHDIDVELIPRDNKKWHVFFAEPGKPMEISTEDIATAAGGVQGIYSPEIHQSQNINSRPISLCWIGAVSFEKSGCEDAHPLAAHGQGQEVH